MDSIIISGIRIYFPKSSEELPIPSCNMPNFAVKGAVGGRCFLLEYRKNDWHVIALPEYEHSGNAIMAAVRRASCQRWR